MLNKTLKISMLFDFYGNLLTKKQQSIVESYFYNDLSLAEIAENIGISRQGVYDHLQRSEKSLEEYEEKLGLVKKYKDLRNNINQLEEILRNDEMLNNNNREEVMDKLEYIKSIL
ncbi:hypothetical protein DFR78_1392 [Halanaerobium sp. MA284_MarDTE_T2]|uniref:YlxM family DNA-binding protein n=1 Tax=Halanaerobium sp. DL-01 TaxID=1653064 RepID=UPI000DF3BD51|nr:YlxM family DNA-binding protein [Halanaerobium sp. DL-01]RCW41140.1 hypothetical protein DFR78_1392 [Halanaerobium sp. MA284_MarDTE_T2]RCW89398.1 hypothetical protein DER71_101219 [Halanaerobium sp. DL-01]